MTAPAPPNLDHLLPAVRRISWWPAETDVEMRQPAAAAGLLCALLLPFFHAPAHYLLLRTGTRALSRSFPVQALVAASACLAMTRTRTLRRVRQDSTMLDSMSLDSGMVGQPWLCLLTRAVGLLASPWVRCLALAWDASLEF